jgi:hypothetical protein
MRSFKLLSIIALVLPAVSAHPARTTSEVPIVITSDDAKLASGNVPTLLPSDCHHVSRDVVADLQLINHLFNLKYAFFTELLGNLSSSTAYSADPAYAGLYPIEPVASSTAPSVVSTLSILTAQTKVQLATIQQVLINYGISIVPACDYSFGDTSLVGGLNTGSLIINSIIGYLTTVTAHECDLSTIISSILATQARHDALLRFLTSASAYPTPFDTAIPGDYAYSLNFAYITPGSCPADLPFKKIELLRHQVFGKPDPTKPPPTAVTFFYDPSDKVEKAKNLYLGWIGQLGAVVYTPFTKNGTDTGYSPPPLFPTWTAKGTIYVVLTTTNQTKSPEDLPGDTLKGPSEIILS